MSIEGASFPSKSLVAMIGLKPLPGAPLFGGSEQAVVDRAMQDLEIYAQGGAEAVLIENSGDLPYMKPPLDDAALRLVEHVCALARRRFRGPVGLQLLEAANEDALRIAGSCGLDFIRVEGYVFAHIGGAGLIEGCAGRLLRLRKRLKAQGVRVFADVRKKHCAHALTGDLDLAGHVRQAEFFLADGIIVTGPRTGAEPQPQDLLDARAASALPILIGSGMTEANLAGFFPLADAFIVGSTFRQGGAYLADLCADRFQRFSEQFQRLKSGGSAG